MTDTQKLPSSKPVSDKPDKASLQNKPSVWPLIVLILIVFTLSALTSVYFWQQLERQNTLIDLINKDKTNSQKRVGQLELSLNSRLKKVEEQAGKQIDIISGLSKQSHFNTQQLHDLGARSRADWLLAETEYLLHLANQRLSLEHDIRGAEAILISADKVLAENSDPGLIPVRQALAKEILTLQQTPLADLDGLYMQLSAMIESLDLLNELAFISRKANNTSKQSTIAANPADTQPEQPKAWQALWQEIWADLKKAFVIRRLDQPVQPLLAPEQSYYLKQNLRLMLEQASLALLDGKQLTYQDSLDKAEKWLNDYFDMTDPQTKILAENITTLKNASIEPPIPDISNSLRLLTAKIEVMYQNHSLGKLSSPAGQNEGETK